MAQEGCGGGDHAGGGAGENVLSVVDRDPPSMPVQEGLFVAALSSLVALPLTYLGIEAGEAQLHTNEQPDGKPNSHVSARPNPQPSTVNHSLHAKRSWAEGEGSV